MPYTRMCLSPSSASCYGAWRWCALYKRYQAKKQPRGFRSMSVPDGLKYKAVTARASKIALLGALAVRVPCFGPTSNAQQHCRSAARHALLAMTVPVLPANQGSLRARR